MYEAFDHFFDGAHQKGDDRKDCGTVDNVPDLPPVAELFRKGHVFYDNHDLAD